METFFFCWESYLTNAIDLFSIERKVKNYLNVLYTATKKIGCWLLCLAHQGYPKSQTFPNLIYTFLCTIYMRFFL